MKMVKNENPLNTMEIQQTPDQKWFGFCEQIHEYTPPFISKKNLIKMLVMKGYEVIEDD